MVNTLIVDAGSTKTDWALLSEGLQSPVFFKTSGINPAHTCVKDILSTILLVRKEIGDFLINKIYFFGAGCATIELKGKIKSSLHEVWRNADISVGSDLTGAGIALFGNSDGIACILGTGSSTGYYKSGEIIEKIPSLGFILGDEGSGVALGKRLLNALFKKQLSLETINNFQEEYHLTLEDLINRVYSSEKPASFIASFSPFIKKHIDKEEIRNLAMSEFECFIQKNIIPYGLAKTKNVGMIGSIAYNYSGIINEIMIKYGLHINLILPSPIHNIINYFRNK